MGLFRFTAPSKQQDGSENHVPSPVVVQHAVESPQNNEDPRREVGVPVPQEAPGRTEVPNDRYQAQGYQADKAFRAYGGVLSHKAVREKIVRVFLIEEQKIVNK